MNFYVTHSLGNTITKTYSENVTANPASIYQSIPAS